MTPPVTTLVAGGAVGTVAAPGRPLTPARPGAVILPPLALATLAPGGAAAVQSLVDGPFQPVLRLVAAGLVAGVLLPVLYVLAAIVRSTGRPAAARVLVPPVGAALAVAVHALLPAGLVSPLAVGAAWLLSLVALEVGPRWRDAWMQERPERVSLLAPSELAAEEALCRLEVLPGVHVASVIVPSCEPERASRLLQRPVVRTTGGPFRLEERVIVACPVRDRHVDSTVASLVALGHTIRSESAAMRRAEGRVDTRQANPLNLLMGMRRSASVEAFRRVVAVTVAALALALLAPVLLGIAIAILVDDGWPILYRQGRVGLRGRIFQVVKFRTMRRDAEKHSGPVFASEADPRVTRVGRLLRRYRLDELPQLLNVLRGEMALVGPRPERPHFFNVLRKDVPLFELRTCVRPGITGWAQVRLPYAAASDDARAKLEYDLYYVTHRTIALDLAILIDTVGVALSGTGSR